MGKLKEWEEKLEQRSKRNEEKIVQAKEDIQRAKQTNREERSHKEKPTEQEKFYKRANTAGKGIAFYFALPLFFGIALVLMIFGFWVWELIF